MVTGVVAAAHARGGTVADGQNSREPHPVPGQRVVPAARDTNTHTYTHMHARANRENEGLPSGKTPVELLRLTVSDKTG